MKRLLPFALLFILAVPAHAATKVFLHAASSFISGYQNANASQGASATTSVTNTITSSSANVQVTATAGGTTIAWLSAPLSAPATLNSGETCNFWGSENSAAANASFRCRIYQYTGGALGAALCVGEVATELTTSATNKTSTCTISSTTFATGDRIGVQIFLENCATSGCPTGSMASGHTVTLNYDGASSGASGDVYVSFTEAISFSSDCPSASNVCVVQVAKSASITCTGGTTCASPAFGANTTAGNNIVVVSCWASTGSTNTLSSVSGQGTFSVQAATQINTASTNYAGGIGCGIAIATNITGGATTAETCTISAGQNQGTCTAYETTPWNSAPAGEQSTGHNTTGTAVSAGTVMVGSNGSLSIVGMTIDDGGGFGSYFGSAGTGYTESLNTGSGNQEMGGEYGDFNSGSLAMASTSRGTSAWIASGLVLEFAASGTTFVPQVGAFLPGP